MNSLGRSKFTPELAHLVKLERLYLNNNRLTGKVPPELNNLTGLKDFSLEANQLIGTIAPKTLPQTGGSMTSGIAWWMLMGVGGLLLLIGGLLLHFLPKRVLSSYDNSRIVRRRFFGQTHVRGQQTQ